jgi:integrase
LLIAQGANAVFLSRQLGHANPNITLGVYAHLFEKTEHAARHSALLDEGLETFWKATAAKTRNQ